MKVIGLTGGIGSGKTLVAKILQDTYGAYILDTDGIAKRQMEPGQESYKEIVEFLGEGILAEDGSIDRKKLAAIIFSDEDKRLKINEITHPKVLEAVMKKLEELREGEKVPYVVIETALMIEAGYDYVCDEVWYVHASEEERRERLKISRNYTDEKIDSIFESQSKAEAFFAKYSKVIENTGDYEWLKGQVELLMTRRS